MRSLGIAELSLSLLLMDVDYYNSRYRLLYRRSGGETNREIDFGFGSVVRARGLVVRWEWAQSVIPGAAFPFPFWPREVFPFPLEIHPPPQPSIQLQLALSVICSRGVYMCNAYILGYPLQVLRVHQAPGPN